MTSTLDRRLIGGRYPLPTWFFRGYLFMRALRALMIADSRNMQIMGASRNSCIAQELIEWWVLRSLYEYITWHDKPTTDRDEILFCQMNRQNKESLKWCLFWNYPCETEDLELSGSRSVLQLVDALQVVSVPPVSVVVQWSIPIIFIYATFL